MRPPSTRSSTELSRSVDRRPAAAQPLLDLQIPFLGSLLSEQAPVLQDDWVAREIAVANVGANLRHDRVASASQPRGGGSQQTRDVELDPDQISLTSHNASTQGLIVNIGDHEDITRLRIERRIVGARTL